MSRRVQNFNFYQGSQRGANAPPSRARESVAGVSSAGHGSVAETTRSRRTNRTHGTQAAAPAPAPARDGQDYAAMSDEEILTHSDTIVRVWFRTLVQCATMRVQMGVMSPEAYSLQVTWLREMRGPEFANSPLVLRKLVEVTGQVRDQMRLMGQGQGQMLMGPGPMMKGPMMFGGQAQQLLLLNALNEYF